MSFNQIFECGRKKQRPLSYVRRGSPGWPLLWKMKPSNGHFIAPRKKMKAIFLMSDLRHQSFNLQQLLSIRVNWISGNFKAPFRVFIALSYFKGFPDYDAVISKPLVIRLTHFSWDFHVKGFMQMPPNLRYIPMYTAETGVSVKWEALWTLKRQPFICSPCPYM